MSLIFRSLSIISFIVLILYYPALFAETSLLDDRGMLTGLSSLQHFDLISVFFPQSNSGLYYRPMIYVSFLIDRFIWNLDPAIMHLENILLHLANTLLVFFIARLIISKTSKLPLFAALLFAVHPVASESVNWISGRTDLLATMFVLASTYSILCFRHSKRIWWLVASIVTLIMGILAKETAIGFIPALVFIMTSKRESDSSITDELHIRKYPLTVFLLVCVLSLFAALLLSQYFLSIAIVLFYFLYLLWCGRDHLSVASLKKYFLLFSCSIISLWALFWGIRKLAFSSQSPHIQRTLALLFSDINHTLSLFFRGAGFYAKKFIYPFPLSFVIRDVSPYYTLFGIILLCLAVVLIIRRKLPDSLAIAGFLMIAPVLPLTFESIAWTSYAERYVYPATPFWILSLIGYAASSGFDRLSSRTQRWSLIALSLLVIIMAVATFQRNLVWQTNIPLFRDSVEKTPGYKPLRGLYMAALFEKELYDEALQQYRIAQSLPTIEIKYNPYFDLAYVQILIAKKEFDEADRQLDLIDNKMAGKEPAVYETYLEIAPRMILKTVDINEKKRIAEKMLVSYNKWYDLKKDPMILYRKGQFLLSLNKRVEAGKLFARVAKAFPETNSYRGYSEKLAKKLGK
ncbi:MAG: glycosyltransferase family 39 protein [Desulfuromonadaceae bacterium]|nr:glycosyltransferase family 39 protein [Desulfuromonadaceae bacterium]